MLYRLIFGEPWISIAGLGLLSHKKQLGLKLDTGTCPAEELGHQTLQFAPVFGGHFLTGAFLGAGGELYEIIGLNDEKLDETVEALPAFSAHGTDRSGFRAAVRELEAGGLPGLVPTDPGGDGIVVMNLDLHGFESSGGTATSGLREFCKSCWGLCSSCDSRAYCDSFL